MNPHPSQPRTSGLLSDAPATRPYLRRGERLPFLEEPPSRRHHDLLVMNQREDLTDDPSCRGASPIFNLDFP